MRYKTLHYLSLSYSIAMGAMSAYFVVYSFSAEGFNYVTVIWAISLFGMLAQLLYTLFSRRVLISEPFEEIDTLDNEMLYSEEDEPRIIQNSGFAVFCALIGGIVSTAILIFCTLTFQVIFTIEFEILELTLVTLFIVLGMLLSIPAVIYNFRTYKLSGTING